MSQESRPSSVKTCHRCPLCQTASLTHYHSASHAVPWRLYAPTEVPRRELRFFRCEMCDLVVKDPDVRPTADQERAHYVKHNNDLQSGGYREHLSRLLDRVIAHVPTDSVGLDYGCGPVLSIEVLAQERGVECRSYDPHFFPATSLLLVGGYDFITCSEVAEHFARPDHEFERLCAMLKVGGILGVMTQLVPEDFADWWYHRDPTHLIFYSPRVFEWIAQRYHLQIVERSGGVFIFRKDP